MVEVAKNPYLFWDGRSGFFEDSPFWIHVAKPLGHLAIRDGWTVLKQHDWWSIIAGAHAPGCLAPMFSPFKVTPVFADLRVRRIPEQKGGGSWGVGELRQETELLRSRFWRRSKFRVFVAKPTDLTGKDPFVEACGCLHHQIPLHSLLKSKNIFAGTSTCHKPHKPYRIYRCNCRHWNNWIKILLSWWF